MLLAEMRLLLWIGIGIAVLAALAGILLPMICSIARKRVYGEPAPKFPKLEMSQWDYFHMPQDQLIEEHGFEVVDDQDQIRVAEKVVEVKDYGQWVLRSTMDKHYDTHDIVELLFIAKTRRWFDRFYPDQKVGRCGDSGSSL